MAPSVNAAATQPHFVSVLMCSGPDSGKVFAVLVQDLVHRRKKLDIGTHVLVKRHDGSKRVKGVVVHMNPFLNAELPTPAKAKAVPVPNLPRQQPAKRPCMPEQPSLADDVAVRAVKRSKPGPSQPNGVSALQPALFIRCINQEPEPPRRRIFGPQSTRYPTRHRVRRELVYGKTSMKLKGSSQPVSVEELDGIVPLDCLADIVSVNELCDVLTQTGEEAVSVVGPFHSTPISAPPNRSDAPSITPYFKGEFQPLRPAPYSRNLFAAEPRVERHADNRLDDGLYPASFLGMLMSSPRMA